ncbi:serine hydrolase [Paenibacillus tritici]|uniref:Serine hydrolase n=1 Tax=Paenibacillus tritici TaxID=1873425 RepID=A0ABX2DX79_9BACL|nr:serine hydrolase [Paenibacillus tritici]QUL58126.1 serine hydrolase [Paenibacillus tritici]
MKAKAGAAEVSAVQDGEVLISKGDGVTGRTPGSGVDANRDTFRIGSVSKVFTAAAIMQLVDQGKLSLRNRVYGKRGDLFAPFWRAYKSHCLLTL